MLKFTPRNVAEMEYEMKAPFTSLLEEFSVRNVLLLIRKGLGIGKTDQDADKYLEGELKSKSLDEVYFDLIKQLQDDGFLSRKVKLEAPQMDKKEEVASPKAGRTEKVQPAK